MAEEQQEPTAEALKQRRKREKAAAKDVALGVEKFTVEVAGVFKANLKSLMKLHGFNNQQEVFQNLLRNVLDADFETAAQMLRCVTTPFEITQEVSRTFHNESLQAIQKDPGDEIIEPISSLLLITAELQVLSCAFGGTDSPHESVHLHRASLNVQTVATIARNVGDVWAGGCAACQNRKKAQSNDADFHVNPFD